jgi:hypothetical protein
MDEVVLLCRRTPSCDSDGEVVLLCTRAVSENDARSGLFVVVVVVVVVVSNATLLLVRC